MSEKTEHKHLDKDQSLELAKLIYDKYCRYELASERIVLFCSECRARVSAVFAEVKLSEEPDLTTDITQEFALAQMGLHFYEYSNGRANAIEDGTIPNTREEAMQRIAELSLVPKPELKQGVGYVYYLPKECLPKEIRHLGLSSKKGRGVLNPRSGEITEGHIAAQTVTFLKVLLGDGIVIGDEKFLEEHKHLRESAE
ncbi:hypothetical protein JW758_01440 [Candidatus Peregrinibacteria bacterium]|nr:hypothetical protein [Candidatus Peregrinibacteria bacterium]